MATEIDVMDYGTLEDENAIIHSMNIRIGDKVVNDLTGEDCIVEKIIFHKSKNSLKNEIVLRTNYGTEVVYSWEVTKKS